HTRGVYPKESLWFNKSEDWDPSRLIQGIRKIVFCDEFDIADLHVEAIIAVGPDFCHSLQDFRAGDSETGRGASLRDAAMVRFAAACPNLVHVQLDGGRNLGDASLLAFFNNCPKLRYIQVSGNDRCTGDVQGSALDELREAPEKAKKLDKIRLTDQMTSIEKSVKNLSMVRKKLVIELGETRERGSGVHTWLRGKKKFGYQAFGGRGGFSQYGGW
ncbi:hypothetical protein DL95DRAFT_321950, partial [Leptodontidium sp. 2 PMI_412]